MGKSLNDHHNDGQTDASIGKYDPPHTTGSEFAAFCGVSHKSLSEVHEENVPYGSGQDNVDD
jgi:hypothetical protein